MKRILIWGFVFLLSMGAYGKELNEYLGKVQTLEKTKKYKEIDTLLEEAINEYPEETIILKLQAKNLINLGRYEEAYGILEGLIIVDGVYTKTDKELYEMQINNIKKIQQKKIFMEDIDLDDELKAYVNEYESFDLLTDSNEIFKKGNDLFKAKDYKGALKIYEMDKSGDIRNLFGAGLTSKFLGKLPESIGYFNQIIEKDPTFTRAYKEVAMAYQANKEYDKAIENFKRYLLEVPEERTYLVVANIYIGSFKDNQKAREILLEAKDFFPQSKEIGDLLKNVNKKLGINE